MEHFLGEHTNESADGYFKVLPEMKIPEYELNLFVK